MANPANRCIFLELPVELRLGIYSYAILDCKHITIGTAKLVGSSPDIVYRLYGKSRAPYPGIPAQHEPVVETDYCPTFLSAAKPATTPASTEPTETAYAHTLTAYQTLSLLNRQIAEELRSHFAIPTRRETSLFVSYPYGLHILHTTTPQLLRQSKSVHLAGTYTPRLFCPNSAASLGPAQAPKQAKLQGDLVPDSEKQLKDLFRSSFGPTSKQQLEMIDMRIYYPGGDSYSAIWTDDKSPVVVALRNVAAGRIGVEVWRGRYGIGVRLTATPTTANERVVSNAWRKLEEGDRGQPGHGSWIVDPEWPAYTV